MGKVFRLIVVILAITLSGIFLYPTYQWFFADMDPNLKEAAVQPKEMIGQEARVQAERDVQLLEQSVRDDDLLPPELEYFHVYAKNSYKRAKTKLPNSLSSRDVVRYTYSRDDLVEFARNYHGQKVLDVKTIKEKAFNLGLDLAGGLGATLQADFSPLMEKLGREPNAQDVNEAMLSAVDAVRNRADRFGATEPNIRRQGSDQILIELPGEEDPDAISRLVTQQGSLTFQLVNMEQTNIMSYYFANNPSAIELIDVRTGIFADTSVLSDMYRIYPSYTRDQFGEEIFRGYYVLESTVAMDGLHIQDVRIASTEFGEPTVNFSLDNEGAVIFGRLTAENVGRQLAVVMEGSIRSMAGITGAIPGGSVQVTGFTPVEAQQLSLALKSSGLPVGLSIINIQTVGPSLGAETIAAGVKALIYGFILVVAFAVIYYKGSGVQASFTLLLNLVFTLALLSSIGFTLTLTSMAGIILNVGMAIDANVLIFERIKEELRAGHSRKIAIDRGFSRAFSAIFDSNITTFIVALFLSQMGSGPVKGFAITLAIGILTNLFTAVYISRLLFDIGSDWFRASNISIGYGKSVQPRAKHESKERQSIPFIRLSKMITPIGFIVLIGLWAATFSHKGFNVGIDFSAGLSMNVYIDGEDSTNRLEEVLKEIDNVKVVDVDDKGYFRISVAEQDISEFQRIMEQKILTTLQSMYSDVRILSTEFVGSSFSKEIISGAWKAIAGSISLILIYLWFRFKRFGYSLATLAGTVHDVIFVLGFIGALQLEVSSATIAAVLAILAYSLNDSIVIFDRIRESSQNLRFGSRIEDIINGSLTETLTRTILTTSTTMITIIPLILIATGSVRLFAIKMLAGIAIGTYSSIFISSLLYYLIVSYRRDKQQTGGVSSTKRVEA
ncbi:protein translocase subunit SecD [Entomospira nematocerorum]|uniref:Multifunctional fusion protein n=1 Tax=Entomospira nematocerorum TaxID=2719987 RepID=A0A968KU53_9SPIO|nr:protein translocase subunit SecD [Entomospira nematocera]NIZ46894.1 protein translocase subunit SecD [Entomospira nematocera]WDI33307.1 protein translocase subunit SecD [Entomospira nematocera]